MLENPEILQELVKRTGAKSTDLEAPETCEHLLRQVYGIREHGDRSRIGFWEAGHTPAADKPRNE